MTSLHPHSLFYRVIDINYTLLLRLNMKRQYHMANQSCKIICPSVEFNNNRSLHSTRPLSVFRRRSLSSQYHIPSSSSKMSRLFQVYSALYASSKVHDTSSNASISDCTDHQSESQQDVPTIAIPTEYLHLAPDGDWWVGSELYAAKHLPSNYVRSIALPKAPFDQAVLTNYTTEDFIHMYDSGELLPPKNNNSR